jgi:hypothetical protein
VAAFQTLGVQFPTAPVESSRASPPHRPRENRLAHSADTSRSNLADALSLLSTAGVAGSEIKERTAWCVEVGLVPSSDKAFRLKADGVLPEGLLLLLGARPSQNQRIYFAKWPTEGSAKSTHALRGWCFAM